jgi:hypothetical protein
MHTMQCPHQLLCMPCFMAVIDEQFANTTAHPPMDCFLIDEDSMALPASPTGQ